MRRAEGRAALHLGARVVYAADAPFWQLVACMTGCRGGGCSRPTPHLLARTAAQMLRIRRHRQPQIYSSAKTAPPKQN